MRRTLLELIMEKENLDEFLAESWIREGYVIANGEKTFLPSLKFEENTFKYEILKKNKNKYVSRAALKLIEAIKKFKIDIKNKVCLDIGSSTGGFVQVLLENQAKKVYAVDCGTNQLDYSLRTNPKIKIYEKTNLKNLTRSMFEEEIDFVSCDVSFISSKHVFKVCKEILNENTTLMLLIKPQFEASSKYVETGGFVKEEHHHYIINKVINFAKSFEFKNEFIAKSPITGEKSKNIEYISLFRKEEINE
ncbi:TlyA family RNA methyltransferase [[Mycoplasma] anseris]|uniref:TlyA family rRNA (Cytidine-2'-O)-methyltransferase n=1 Tax=[Mycoplasma] anseris TaxID=92400 RepID=A0A2Z4NDL1_9BACT|nr:TlyA family RNA methyltransferase [[Mycoplasma] anseris]AWX69684.1 TlyA family rRNA (cytidine-2'-O)-methyltransferase [[Mycoplasma] anseris]